MAKQLPDAAYRLHSKRGDNDCTIVVLATYLRRDPEEVLIAASKVSKHVWHTGLACTEMVKVAKRLGVSVRWNRVFNLEEDTGLLWVSYHDVADEHVVFLDEGKIFDSEHNPVSMWDAEDYLRHTASFGNQLLKRVGD